MGKKTLFLSHLCLFLPKKRTFLPKLSLFLPKKCVFFPKKRLFIRNKRKNRVKKGCFWPKNALKKSVYFFRRKRHFFRSYCYFFRRNRLSFRRKGHFFGIWGTKKREEIYKYIYFILHLRHHRVRTCACIVCMLIRARALGRQKKTCKESSLQVVKR